MWLQVARLRCMYVCGAVRVTLLAEPLLIVMEWHVVQAYMRLKGALGGRVVRERLPECVANEEERAAALELLGAVCGRIGQMGAASRGSLDQKAMLLHMAAGLGRWLLAGVPGSVSASGQLDGRDVAHMPPSTLSLHNIVLGAEC